MKLGGLRRSRNVRDRRGGGAKMAGGGLGLGAIVLFLASIFFPDAVPFLQMVGIGDPAPRQISSSAGAGRDDEHREFAEKILATTEDFWNQEIGQQYPEPELVLFSGRENSRCGPATAASGPFYCPGDKRIYIDPAFYDVMAKRLNAPGDFAQAYVIAHEVAHHAQNVQGIIPEIDRLRQRAGRGTPEANWLTVRLELQADCYSGVWTNFMQRRYNNLDRNDIKEALNAAAQIGDDTLQARSGGHVDPRKFTHGSSEMRVNWFFKGMQEGDIRACDTLTIPQSQL